MYFESARRRVAPPLACLLAGVLAPLGARAQPASADAAPPLEPTSPAADVSSEVQAPPPAQPNTATQPAADPTWTNARSVVVRGEALFNASNYDAALSEFERAFRLLDGHPRQYFVLYNLGLCHERMFRYDLALPLYEQYLRLAPAEEPDRAAVEAVMRSLRGLLASVEIESNVAAEVWVDNRRMGDAPGRVLLPAGRHLVELRARVYESARLELNVAARQSARLSFELQRLSTYSGLRPLYFWSGAGLSVAALLAGSVFGVQALAARDAGEAKARLHLDSARERKDVQHASLAADVCFGAAALFAVTSTVLFFLSDFDASERVPSRARLGTTRARVQVTLAGLSGRF